MYSQAPSLLMLILFQLAGTYRKDSGRMWPAAHSLAAKKKQWASKVVHQPPLQLNQEGSRRGDR